MSDGSGQTSEFDEIRIGGHDANNREVLDVYANEEGRYAVYQTAGRVVLLYSDNPQDQRAQRRRLAAFATLRSQIDGKLSEWRCRDPRLSRLPRSAREFDMQVASALVEGFEGNTDAGLAMLRQTLVEIDAEKASRARLSYLIWTIVTAGVFIAACLAIYFAADGFKILDPNYARSIVHAMVAGVLGAFYSIALGIERREIRNDQRRLDHVTDALVRISIGVLAAFVLETFLLSGAVQIGFANGAQLRPGGGAAGGVHPTTWPIELIAGFLAGFAERLVPDLLNSYAVKQRDGEPGPTPLVPMASQKTGSTATPASAQAGTATETETEIDSDLEPPPEPGIDADVDGCVIGHAGDDNATPDDALPPAAGGVARE